ncbi:MAG: rsbW [Parachlamydiales bacterium]|nr:rsbW [Parachlamydiales bacterium]
MKSRVFCAALDELHEMLQWIRSEAAQMGFGPSDLYRIELAAEEAIVNVIHHSYSKRGGEIGIGIQSQPHAMQIEITDSGQPFNPLEQKPKQAGATLEEREEGGLGIVFIEKCMDQISYERKNNRNVLTLTKNRK